MRLFLCLERLLPLNRRLQHEPTKPLWIRATAIAAALLLFFFTLAQAAHTHGSAAGLKQHHTLQSAAAENTGATDQCPLCAGGVTFFVPGSFGDAACLAVVFAAYASGEVRRVQSPELAFALSSRPPPTL